MGETLHHLPGEGGKRPALSLTTSVYLQCSYTIDYFCWKRRLLPGGIPGCHACRMRSGTAGGGRQRTGQRCFAGRMPALRAIAVRRVAAACLRGLSGFVFTHSGEVVPRVRSRRLMGPAAAAQVSAAGTRLQSGEIAVKTAARQRAQTAASGHSMAEKTAPSG